ncbi:sensor histidine kinase [uncultured Pseudokineococcus sp.]|uniref:sensor histidine kinase n=1 Tax=uncultured Pseudokineococcus sp. TaxID=1642928 RepID=UPI00260DAE15|nr:histidine kinase [uncultured Pseudokineococcus sp.]
MVDPADAAAPPLAEGTGTAGGRGTAVDGGWVRPRPGRRALLADVGWGAVATTTCVLGLELTRAVSDALPQAAPARVEDVAWTVLVAAPLAVRRLLPLTAMVVSTGAFVALGERHLASASTFTLNLVLFLVLLSGTAWARDRRRLAVVWVVVLTAMAGWYLLRVVLLPVGTGPTSAALVGLTALINVVYFAGALLGGRALWRGARDSAALHRTAAQLRREQERAARAAVVAERLRIARELHDVVAHHVSTTGVRAAAARRVLERGADDGTGVARAAAALREVEEGSRSAVTEMRDLLGVLRDPGADPDSDAGTGPAAVPPGAAPRELPQPSPADLPRLVEEVRACGLDVGLVVVGEPAPLPGTTGTSLHRLVQEALANVARHSAAGAARVVVRWVPDGVPDHGRGGGHGRPPGHVEEGHVEQGHVEEGHLEKGHVEVEVVDDGPARSAAQRSTGTGLGHVGMRERAALAGGWVEVGPRPGGGYRVRARYPLAEPARPPR